MPHVPDRTRTMTLLYDKRSFLPGFMTLFGFMAAHMMMETARDTLFLRSLPAERLPWAYLAIAGLAAVMTRANNALLNRSRDQRRVMSASLIVAAAVTVIIWTFIRVQSTTALYLLYVWTGLVASVVVVQFWVLMERTVTVTEAKRFFGFVAAGGVSGAIAGSFAAERLLGVLAPRHLLITAASVMVVCAVGPLCFSKDHRTSVPPPPKQTNTSSLFYFAEYVYLRRLLGVVVISTVVVTGVDYLFKSVVADTIAPENLGRFFARYYLALNLLSLIALLTSSHLLARAGVTRSLLILPSLLGLGFAGFLVAGAATAVPVLAAALLIKAADGGLRHSVHRVSIEVLYLPVPRGVRDRAKGFIDAVGHRGGQALASIAILASIAVDFGYGQLAAGLGGAVVVWIVMVLAIRGSYVELFRQRLRDGTVDTHVELASLDLQSLETLVGSLNSDDDDEVCTALELLERHNKAHLVPFLILYHPNPTVVLRALEIFQRSPLPGSMPVVRRLLREPRAEVRAAALRTIFAAGPDPRVLRRALKDEAPLVRATALIAALAEEHGDSERFREELRIRVAEGDAVTRIGIAAAVRCSQDPRFVSIVQDLTAYASIKSEGRLAPGYNGEDLALSREIVRAMAAVPSPGYLPWLLPLLSIGSLRADVRRALQAIGPPAFQRLRACLEDPSLSARLRRHVPRSISQFDPALASSVLTQRLPKEEDGTVRHKILRGLGRLHTDHPGLKLDRAILQAHLDLTMQRALRLLEWSNVLAGAQVERPSYRTPSGELLRVALHDKSALALERVFRILDLMYPAEDWPLLWEGVHDPDPRKHADSLEILSVTQHGAIGEALVALLGEATESARSPRARAALQIEATHLNYEHLLALLLEEESETIRCIAAHHIGELGLVSLRDKLRVTKPGRHGVFLKEAVDKALARLGEKASSSHVA